MVSKRQSVWVCLALLGLFIPPQGCHQRRQFEPSGEVTEAFLQAILSGHHNQQVRLMSALLPTRRERT